jgi:Bacterial self-protective colicin-like immunity
MNNEDWRALIEAFLSGENDVETFQEEFLEAWNETVDADAEFPAPIEELGETLDAFDADADSGEETVTEAELRDKAREALDQLKKLSA